MDPELTTLIARPRAWQRWTRWPGVIILGLGLWSLVYGFESAVILFLAVGAWCTAEFWRGIRVTGDTLYMQGRVTRRTLPLADIRQVGLGPMGAVWVKSREGQTQVLHMAEVRTDQKGTAADIAERLRELAVEAGADLEPEPPGETAPPKPASLFFGW